MIKCILSEEGKWLKLSKSHHAEEYRVFLTFLWNILDMQTVEIEGSVPTAAVYLTFSDGQNTAYTYLTNGSSRGNFNN